jgi:hypothetical protein
MPVCGAVSMSDESVDSLLGTRALSPALSAKREESRSHPMKRRSERHFAGEGRAPSNELDPKVQLTPLR